MHVNDLFNYHTGMIYYTKNVIKYKIFKPTFSPFFAYEIKKKNFNFLDESFGYEFIIDQFEIFRNLCPSQCESIRKKFSMCWKPLENPTQSETSIRMNPNQIFNPFQFRLTIGLYSKLNFQSGLIGIEYFFRNKKELNPRLLSD